MKILVTAATALALLGLVGCGGDDETPTPFDINSTGFLDEPPSALVSGTLYRVDADGKNPEPVAGTIILTGGKGSTLRTEVDATGRYTIGLNPGDYAVTGTSPQSDGGVAQCAAKAPKTTISLETPAVVDVFCYVQ